MGQLACANGPGLVVDCLAEVLVNNLNLRAGPSTGAASLGHLSLHDSAYVVGGPVEADGYTWYELGAVRPVFDCADATLVCGDWFGWAVAATPDGDPWLGPLALACPTERTTDAFISLEPAERLACAGDGEWKLVVYLAEEGGRGCFPIWVTDPRWLFAACNLLFPQPVERELDEEADIQVFVPPEMGSCTYSLYESGCPFAPFKFSWVEITGHLDDTAASRCTATKLWDALGPDYSPPPPPDPHQVVYQCRLAFVVTAVQETAAAIMQ